MPLTKHEVDAKRPFSDEELLYRRVAPTELNSKGEVDPSRINGISFDNEVETAPSVNRSDFSNPEDVLAFDCANGKDVSEWAVCFVRVDCLPGEITSGDGRAFHFVPIHVPLERCGAHSVVASVLATDRNTYVKAPRSVRNDFKVKFALKLQRIEQVFGIGDQKPIPIHSF